MAVLSNASTEREHHRQHLTTGMALMKAVVHAGQDRILEAGEVPLLPTHVMVAVLEMFDQAMLGALNALRICPDRRLPPLLGRCRGAGAHGKCGARYPRPVYCGH